MNGDLFAEVNRAFAVWGLTFAALMAYWTTSEAAQPGRQYADPLLPCLSVALMITGPLLQVWALADTIRLRRARDGR